MWLEGLQLAKIFEMRSHLTTKHVTESLFQDELEATTHEKQIADDITNPFAFK